VLHSLVPDFIGAGFCPLKKLGLGAARKTAITVP
jgi:hypothetical protein